MQVCVCTCVRLPGIYVDLHVKRGGQESSCNAKKEGAGRDVGGQSRIDEHTHTHTQDQTLGVCVHERATVQSHVFI